MLKVIWIRNITISVHIFMFSLVKIIFHWMILLVIGKPILWVLVDHCWQAEGWPQMSEVTPKLADFDPQSYWPHIRGPSCCASRVTRGRRRGGIKLCPPHFWVTPNSDRLDIWGRSEHLGTGGEIFVESKQRKYTLDEMFLPVNVRQQIG